jgi:D-threo-aldose 1-dehydrogenase
LGRPLIETRPVGKTGLHISRIGFGGAPLGDIVKAPSAAEAEKLLDAAWDAGIRYFDTAPFYGSGLSERRIGDYLRGKPRDEFVLSSKVGRLLLPDAGYGVEKTGSPAAMPFRPHYDYSYDGIMRSFEHSLQRLGLDRIDILLIHDIGRFSHREDHELTWQQVTAGGGIRAMEQLKAEGVVKAIGAGVNEYPVINALLDEAPFDVFLLANRYTLLDQEVIDTLLPRCEREGVAIIDGAPLNSGILLTGAVPGAIFDYAPAREPILEKTRRIEAVCARHGVSLLRAALNFPLGHQAITSLIPGFARVSDLEQNLVHLSSAIPPALWEDLRAEGLIHKHAPAPVTPTLG